MLHKSKNDQKNAWNYLLRILTIRSYSSGELKQKLVIRGLDAIEIDRLLMKAERLGLINEAMIGESLINQAKCRLKGYLWLKLRLTQRKIPRKVTEYILERYVLEDEESVANKLLEKVLPKGVDISKIVRLLKSRGFRQSIIYNCIRGVRNLD